MTYGLFHMRDLTVGKETYNSKAGVGEMIEIEIQE